MSHTGQHDPLHRIDLLLDREHVARHVLGQSGHLRADQAAEREDHREGQQHGQQHRGDTAEMHAPQQVDERREQEGQQHRERERDQHRAAEVKPGDHDDRDGDGQQAAQTGCFGRRDLGRAPVQRVGKIRHRIRSFCPAASRGRVGPGQADRRAPGRCSGLTVYPDTVPMARGGPERSRTLSRFPRLHNWNSPANGTKRRCDW